MLAIKNVSAFTLLIITLGLVRPFDAENRIVGGSPSGPNEFPYNVAIFKNGTFQCGGSIIAQDWVLSAADCFVDEIASWYTILTGTTLLNSTHKKQGVEKLQVHLNFILRTNDIALLKLNESLTFDDSVNKIDLPDSDTDVGTEVVLTGWGQTSYEPDEFTNDLQKINLLTISNQQCIEALGQWTVPDSNICTLTKKGEGACLGDSGGPLVDPKKKTLVGIVSGGNPCATGKPDVFTRVYSHLSWISKMRE